MPISANDMMKPAVVDYLEGYTIARLPEKDKYMDFTLYSRSQRTGTFLQQGYTPGQRTLDTPKVDINNETLSF